MCVCVWESKHLLDNLQERRQGSRQWKYSWMIHVATPKSFLLLYLKRTHLNNRIFPSTLGTCLSKTSQLPPITKSFRISQYPGLELLKCSPVVSVGWTLINIYWYTCIFSQIKRTSKRLYTRKEGCNKDK